MDIDHIAIVVRDIQIARVLYEDFLGFRPSTKIILDNVQKVRVQFFENDKAERIELIEPIDETSPSMNALKKGGGVNHICYKCSNLEQIISLAQAQKIKMVCSPVPGEGQLSSDGRSRLYRAETDRRQGVEAAADCARHRNAQAASSRESPGEAATRHPLRRTRRCTLDRSPF